MISIDWDFFLWRACEAKDHALTFFPGTEKEEVSTGVWVFDWGHNENQSPWLQDLLWAIRYVGFTRVGLDPVETTGVREDKGCVSPANFTRQVFQRLRVADDPTIFLADSHVYGLRATRDAYLHAEQESVRVLHFDAHHDLGYDSDISENSDADCGSWLYHALVRGLAKEAIVVYPDWRVTDFDTEPVRDGHLRPFLEGEKPAVRFTRFSEWLAEPAEDVEVDILNVARSGTWTPPWHDDLFLKFVHGLPQRELYCLDCERGDEGPDACMARSFAASSPAQLGDE